MPLETASTIAELNENNPVGASDTPASLDNHIQLIKAVLKADALVNADIGVNIAAQSHNHTGVYQPYDADTAKLDVAQTFTAKQTFGDIEATGTVTGFAPTFASSAENAAGAIENKTVDPLGIREAFNATGSAPVYACRAWARINGALTGTNPPTAGGNVASVTKNSTGNYTVTFSAAMSSANYCVTANGLRSSGNEGLVNIESTSTGSFVINCTNGGGAEADFPIICVAVFE